MNIKYGDTSLSVRFLEAFLQDEYSSTLRVSGIYDTYTHNNLITYINLPKVVSSEEMYDALLNQYDNIPITYNGETTNKNLLYCFSIVRTIDTIVCSSKSSIKPDDTVEQAMKYLMSKQDNVSLLDFVKQYGWNLTSFISYVDTNSVEEYKIVLTQDKRKNLIPLDANSMVNLSTEDIVFRTEISTGIFKTNSSYTNCTMIVPCEPDSDYIICHRFDNPDEHGEQQPVTLYVGSSKYTNPNVTISTEVGNVEKLELIQGECVSYKTADNAKKILISYPYEKLSYNTSILIVKKNNLSTEDIDTEEFIKDYWLVNSKFLDYLFGSCITELSSEEEIYKIQSSLQSLLPKKYIKCNGAYTKEFRDVVKEYQELYKNPLFTDRRPKIFYSLGYIDTQTEAQILKDITNGVTLYY